MSAGNSFGHLFRITTFGESHGGGVGVVIDGCPPGLAISKAEIQSELDRRKPGQSAITTPRSEQDEIHILSGWFDGQTTGAPLMLLAHNKDTQSGDYLHLKDLYRPGHADYTFQQKYGIRDWRGSGRASARETLARVAAGAVAQKYLKETLGVEIVSYVEKVGHLSAPELLEDPALSPLINRAQVESNIIRCPHAPTAEAMIDFVSKIRDDGDSVGGVICSVVKNAPVGLGEPVFDKLHADLGKAMLSINAVKGFEIGSGFSGASLLGSQHNDSFYMDKNIDSDNAEEKNKIRTRTNHAGGVLGGISNGEAIYFRTAFKPTSTIMKRQQTVTMDQADTELEAHGRHDPCVLPRAVPIVDAMTALVLIDHYLRHKAQNL